MSETGDVKISAELLHQAQLIAKLGSFVIDLGRGEITLSREMCRMLRVGDAPQVMPIGEYRRRFYHPDDRDRSVARAEAAYQAGAAFNQEVRVVCGDGEVIWVRSTSSTVDDDGRRLVVGVLVDVTDEVRVARELVEQRDKLADRERLFRVLAENAFVGIYLLQDERLVYANPALEKMFGYEHHELEHYPWQVFLPEERDEARDIHRRRLGGEDPGVKYERKGVRKDGTLIDIELQSSAILFDGRPAMLGNIHDLSAQRIAEAEARDQQRRFEQLAERSLAGVYILHDEKFVYTNPAFETMLGVERDSLLGQDALKYILPEDHDLVRDQLQRRRDARSDTSHYELRARRADGTPLWLEVLGATMEYRGEQAMIGTVVDITERKRALHDLERSERRWRAFIEQAPIAIGVQRLGLSVYGNRRYREMFGYPDEASVVGVPIGENWIAPDRDAIADRARERSMARTVASAFESTAVRRDGSQFPARADVVSVELPDGLAGIAFITDLTESRAAETAVRASEARFREIAETIDEVFWVRDPLADRLLYVSPAFEKLWGRDPAPLVATGGPWPPHVLEWHSSQGSEQIYQIVIPGGARRWIRDRSFIVRDASGALQRIVGVASDITEQRELAFQLQQSQKMEAIGVLAGGVAHDFNNILAVILSYSDLLLEDVAPSDPMHADLVEIHAAGQRAAQMTRQLLAFSRRQVLQPQHIDLNDVLMSMQRMFHRLIGEHIELVVSPWREPALVFVDRGQIEQVLMNLVVNARDAMPRGGQIAIALSTAEQAGARQVVISVRDTGIGMDEATRARIFEPFFTTKDVGKGTGLGLSTVFGIVQQSSGTISVTSAPGAGTTFEIRLPRSGDDVAEDIASMPDGEVRGTETVLLVEDDDAVRKLAGATLARRGYRVLEARSGGDALILSERHQGSIDVIVSDIVMPLMNGDELVARIRAARPEIRAVLVSGYPDGFDTGSPGIVFVPKPFTPRMLLAGVRAALASPH